MTLRQLYIVSLNSDLIFIQENLVIKYCNVRQTHLLIKPGIANDRIRNPRLFYTQKRKGISAIVQHLFRKNVVSSALNDNLNFPFGNMPDLFDCSVMKTKTG